MRPARRTPALQSVFAYPARTFPPFSPGSPAGAATPPTLPPAAPSAQPCSPRTAQSLPVIFSSLEKSLGTRGFKFHKETQKTKTPPTNSESERKILPKSFITLCNKMKLTERYFWSGMFQVDQKASRTKQNKNQRTNI